MMMGVLYMIGESIVYTGHRKQLTSAKIYGDSSLFALKIFDQKDATILNQAIACERVYYARSERSERSAQLLAFKRENLVYSRTKNGHFSMCPF